MTTKESVREVKRMAGLTGLTVEEFARRMNQMSREDVARAMERLDTPNLEWAVGFEAMGGGR